ncbi:ABC transporter-like protein [Lindgomyces ingoldianus]|uniref:ABC transporter-like protein n=1 Tax=Lindgomyces ingoldianus TaxID=673940 RepID=A0ACB6QYS7_9PLEO|nr:ABC transporter-like protein [Lindgomyces ingoldianus]KAF2471230.1 ABC transporter-like protein [Lindgomyces ingoldianus]
MALTIILQCLGTLAAFGAGTARPLMTIIFGELVNAYNDTSDKEVLNHLKNVVDKKVFILLILFLGQWVLVFTYGSLFSIAALRYTVNLRASYLKAFISQDIEEAKESKAATDLSSNIGVIEDAISEKLGTVLQALATVVSSFIIAFLRSWKLALVLSTSIFFLIFKDLITSLLDARIEKKCQNVALQAAELAEECFTGIRTIASCCAEEKVNAQYERILDQVKKEELRKSSIPAIQYSVSAFVIHAVYSLSFWYGTKLLSREEIDSGGSILIVLLCMNSATNALRSLIPTYSILAKGKAAHASLMRVINAVPRLNPFSTEGLVLDALYSRIKFQDVEFSYPSRPSVKILNRLNLTLGAGKTTAIIGASGSGKSTLVSLLERWYDAQSGCIQINGVDIRSYNLKSLRSNIRVVQQDSVLFNDSVFNNVAYGLIGSELYDMSDNDKRRLVVKVCKDVQAHDFIQQLPQGYNTIVGIRGSLLSGGQRQRIAIARALISNPVILIFDEATSSLDAESECLVQAAIDRVSRGRTTLTIAHKLATIKRADRIVLLKNGVVSEERTHESLLRTSDAYLKIWIAQNLTLEGRWSQDLRKSDDSDVSASRGFDSDPENDLKRNKVTDGSEIVGVDMTEEYSMSFMETSKRVIKASPLLQFIFYSSFIVCFVAGLVYPADSIVFGETLTSWQKHGSQMVQAINFWSLMFFILGIVGFFAFFSVGSLSSIGGTITARIYRGKYFGALVEQPASFFDKDIHTPGFLVARLSTDPSYLQGFVTVLSSLAVSVINLGSFLILAPIFSWRFALVAMFGTLPVIIIASFLRVRSQIRKNKSLSEPLMDSAQYAAEVIANIRTVSSFAMEGEVCRTMERKMESSLPAFYRSLLVTMPLFALSQSGNLLGMTLSFWWSGHLLADHKITAMQIWIVFNAVVTGADAAGEFFGSTASIVHARSACGRISRLDSKRSQILESSKNDKEKLGCGSIDFDSVCFSYPNTVSQPVLQDVSFRVPQGQTVAIVGPSGSGKSTIISLLERFYNPSHGNIQVGGAPLSSLSALTYRSNVSLVSQETHLFEGTVRENILLGVPEEEGSQDLLVQAAREANIHDFIMSLPEGYDTPCGKKGMAFSGGQRQRLAIARALVRNPTILLLDEATSALDSSSELEVKTALKNASVGRTTVAVAHRLSTIQDADSIFVLVNGSIVEKGSHAELISLKGAYWTMCQRQNLD